MEAQVGEKEFFKKVCWGLSKQLLEVLQKELKLTKRGEIRNKAVVSFNLVADVNEKLIEVIIPIRTGYVIDSNWDPDMKTMIIDEIPVGQIGCQILSLKFELLKHKKFDLQDPELFENLGCWVATQL